MADAALTAACARGDAPAALAALQAVREAGGERAVRLAMGTPDERGWTAVHVAAGGADEGVADEASAAVCAALMAAGAEREDAGLLVEREPGGELVQPEQAPPRLSSQFYSFTSCSPVLMAVAADRPACLKALLDGGRDPSPAWPSGRGLLQAAVEFGSDASARYLMSLVAGYVDVKPPVSLRDMRMDACFSDRTPLWVAVRLQKHDLVREMLSVRYKVTKSSVPTWCTMGKEEETDLFLHCCSYSEVDVAVLQDDVEMLRLLLSRKDLFNLAAVDTDYGPGRRPLSVAARRGNVENVRLLLEAGAWPLAWHDYETKESVLEFARREAPEAVRDEIVALMGESYGPVPFYNEAYELYPCQRRPGV